MFYFPPPHLVGVVAATLAGGCETSPTEPDVLAWTITVRVEGESPTADFSFSLSQEDRMVQGVHCAGACAFSAGDTLLGLSDAQMARVQAAIHESGLPDLVSEDYGASPQEAPRYTITYERNRRVTEIRGSINTLPEGLAKLLRVLQGLSDQTLPVIIALESTRGDWPTDAITVLPPDLANGTLSVPIRYAGGCAVHDVDLVAYGGWQTDPPHGRAVPPTRIRAAVVHNDRGDACEALIGRTLHFDLAPLIQTYEDAGLTPMGGPLSIVLENAAPGEEPYALSLVWYQLP